jgi:hypothetical protein
MSLKFPISLVGKRGGGLPLGAPANYWDLNDSGFSNLVEPSLNFVAVGDTPIVESGTAPNGGDCVVTSDTSSLVQTILGKQQVTVSIWINLVSAPPSYTSTFTWRNTVVNGAYMQLGRTYNSEGWQYLMHNAAARGVARQYVTDGWVHWLLTYDGSIMRAYRDGVSQGTKLYTCSVCERNRPMRLGRSYSTPHSPAKFSMLGHWDEAPADEAAAQAIADYLYNGGQGRLYSEL